MKTAFSKLLAGLVLLSAPAYSAEIPAGVSVHPADAGFARGASPLQGLAIRLSPALFQLEDADFDYPRFTSHFGGGVSYPVTRFIELGVWGERQSAKLGLFDFAMKDAYSVGMTAMLIPPSFGDSWQFGFRPGVFYTSWGMKGFAARELFQEDGKIDKAEKKGDLEFHKYRKESSDGVAVEFMAVARHFFWGKRFSIEEAVGFRGFGKTIERSSDLKGRDLTHSSTDTVFAVRGEISIGYHF